MNAVVFRPLPGLTVATLIALAVLVSLGTWQLNRRAEKHLQLENIAQRSQAGAAPVEILLASGDYAAYRAATAHGTFDHAAEAYVYAPRPNEGAPRPGFKVITPLRLSSGGTILVDRGWVDDAHKSPMTRKAGQTEGVVVIDGTLRLSSKPGAFTPPAEAATRTFYQRNAGSIAEALGLTLTSTLILEAAAPTDGGPQPLAFDANIPDNHLQYAITWFALAVVLLLVYVSLHVARGRLKVSR